MVTFAVAYGVVGIAVVAYVARMGVIQDRLAKRLAGLQRELERPSPSPDPQQREAA